MRTIAIIGGGFCGTMAAVNHSRLSDIPLRVLRAPRAIHFSATGSKTRGQKSHRTR